MVLWAYYAKFKEIKIIKMKKLFYFISIAFIISSCATGGGGSGEVVGVLGRPVWYSTDPYGMLYIPAGGFNMGQSDQDVPLSHYNIIIILIYTASHCSNHCNSLQATHWSS